MTLRRAVAILHVAFEDLGVLEKLLAHRGYDVSYRDAGVDDLDRSDLRSADLLVVLGGPIGVYDALTYRLIGDELRLLDHRLGRGRPTLGICLGSQLMARALGARVHAGARKELGWGPIELTTAGRLSPVKRPAGAPVLHWLGDTFDRPAGVDLLASTVGYPHQAFSYGRTALAMQFHVEVTARGLERWLIGHALELATTPGVSVAKLRRGARR